MGLASLAQLNYNLLIFIGIQWNLAIPATIGTKVTGCISEVARFQSYLIDPATQIFFVNLADLSRIITRARKRAG